MAWLSVRSVKGLSGLFTIQTNYKELYAMKISNDKLYNLCNKYQWFTNGDNKQYQMFFDRNTQGASLETLATIIWICSTDWNEQDILEILQQEADLQ